MILESVRVTNFLSHTDSTLDFTDSSLWLIYGDNGAGKSALFDAVEYALYGKHRGGSQQAELLVKQGEPEASIDLVLQLEGRRLRVMHRLARKTGNQGGRLAEQDAVTGQWKPINPGVGRGAVWIWLAQHGLPTHDLYCSAIFLRQGNAAHVLSGTAQQRAQRIAEIIDLSRYTRIAERARSRQRTAQERNQETSGKLNALGDVSDRALNALLERLEDVRGKRATAAKQFQQAQAVAQGAAKWDDLQQQRHDLEQRQSEVERLLADETVIRADAELVASWERRETEFRRFWQQHAHAEQRRAAAEAARRQQETAQHNLAAQQAAQQEVSERRVAMQSQRPVLRATLEASQQQEREIDLEVEIAKARDAADAAREHVQQYAGQDTELEHWRERKSALPWLEQLAQAITKLQQSSDQVEPAREAVATTENKVEAAHRTIEETEAEQQSSAAGHAAALAIVNALTQQIERLHGRISRHDELSQDEEVCPVCDQELDAAAHAHVQAVLADERQQLADHKQALEQAQAQDRRARESLNDASERLRQHQNTLQVLSQRLIQQQERLRQATEAVAAAERDVARGREAISEHHSFSADLLDQVTEAWVTAEQERITNGMRAAQRGAKALEQAQNAYTTATTRLETLQGQRAETAEPLGETEPVAALRRRATTARQASQQASEEIASAERGITELEQQLQTIQAAIARLTGEEASARTTTEQAKQDTAAAEAAAEAIAATHRAAWPGVFASRESFSAIAQDIAGRRENGERVAELEQARGQVQVLEERLGHIKEAMSAIPSEHHIAVAIAQASEELARAEENVLASEQGSIERDIADFAKRRENAARYRAEQEQAAEDAETYGKLYDLLREGGAVQVAVAEDEQRQIVEEVNTVLERLSDPVRVQLGETLRKTSIEIKDVQFRDTSDPIGEPRHFPFLSGGEQFRVALALALALHRRVGREAGTIIVDEGFGALDGNRRDALALHMTDTGRGVLQLGYAQSVIICSHSAEVQRHFPYRWLISKSGGSASVSRPEFDGLE